MQNIFGIEVRGLVLTLQALPNPSSFTGIGCRRGHGGRRTVGPQRLPSVEPTSRGPNGREVGQARLARGGDAVDAVPHGERHSVHHVL